MEIYFQAGRRTTKGGGGAWASFFFLFGSGCGLWIGDYGFWIWETPKMEFFLLTFFFWNWGTPMLLFTQTFFFDFGLLSVDCGLGIGSQKRKFCFLWWEKIKKNALHLRTRRI